MSILNPARKESFSVVSRARRAVAGLDSLLAVRFRSAVSHKMGSSRAKKVLTHRRSNTGKPGPVQLTKSQAGEIIE